MAVIRSDRPAHIEEEMREFLRKHPSAGGVVAANAVGAIIQRVAGTSVANIDNLITELTQLRDLLQKEAQRVQGEIEDYVHASQVALQSTTVIAQSLAQFKHAADRA